MEPLNRFTPLPPIDDGPSEETDSRDENDFFEDADLSETKTDDIFQELGRIITQMEKKARAKHVLYLQSVINSEHAFSADDLGKHLTSLQFVEIFQKHWKENCEEILSDRCNSGDFFLSYRFLRVMWTLSSDSSTVCDRIIEVGFHLDIFEYLESANLHPLHLTEEKPSLIAQGLLGILFGVVRHSSKAWQAFRSCHAVERLQPFRACENRVISCIALMIQSFLVTEDENETIHSGQDTFDFLVNFFKESLKNKTKIGRRPPAKEILEVMNKLAANDENKSRIVKSGGLPCYVGLMEPQSSDREKAEAAKGLWLLAFSCKEDIQKEPGCVEALRSLLAVATKRVKKHAEGALWVIDNKIEAVPETKAATTNGDGGHVFISYQWNSKPTILKIRDALEDAGFNVWIDEDDMSGCVMDAMATAVENASIVLICMSQKYKDSPNCRTEAEYTFRLKKRIVPIRLQKDYVPDGWLGLMAGSKLVLDFSQDTHMDLNMNQLIKEIGDAEKSTNTKKKVAVPAAPVNPLNQRPAPVNASVRDWTSVDVNQWLKKHNLERFQDWFSNMTGAMLVDYASMRVEAPESFFAYMMKEDFRLKDTLAISTALLSLP